MNEIFELPVHYNGKNIELTAQLHRYGYGYKIEVEVNERSIFFERMRKEAGELLPTLLKQKKKS